MRPQARQGKPDRGSQTVAQSVRFATIVDCVQSFSFVHCLGTTPLATFPRTHRALLLLVRRCSHFIRRISWRIFFVLDFDEVAGVGTGCPQ